MLVCRENGEPDAEGRSLRIMVNDRWYCNTDDPNGGHDQMECLYYQNHKSGHCAYLGARRDSKGRWECNYEKYGIA